MEELQQRLEVVERKREGETEQEMGTKERTRAPRGTMRVLRRERDEEGIWQKERVMHVRRESAWNNRTKRTENLN